MPIGLERLLALSANDFVNHDIPTPSPDGATVIFTVANPYESGSLKVWRDQLSMLGGSGEDFEETTSTTFTMASAPDADEVLWVSYIKQ